MTLPTQSLPKQLHLVTKENKNGNNNQRNQQEKPKWGGGDETAKIGARTENHLCNEMVLSVQIN